MNEEEQNPDFIRISNNEDFDIFFQIETVEICIRTKINEGTAQQPILTPIIQLKFRSGKQLNVAMKTVEDRDKLYEGIWSDIKKRKAQSKTFSFN